MCRGGGSEDRGGRLPFNGFPKRVEGVTTGTRLKILDVMIWDAFRGWLGMPPRYIPAVGSYGELAVMPSAGSPAHQAQRGRTSLVVGDDRLQAEG